MDKRFKPMTLVEALAARRALADELAADPGMPIPAVVRKIRRSLRITIVEYAKLCGVSARTLRISSAKNLALLWRLRKSCCGQWGW